MILELSMDPDRNALCVILGGGGHARVLIDCVRASASASLYAVLDCDRSLWGKDLIGVPIVGGDDLLPQLVQENVTKFVVGVGAVGNSWVRRRLFELALDQGLTPLTVCHPSAHCSPWARLGGGSVLYPAAVVNAGAVLGVNVIVNTGAIVEHDCVIGDHAHIATGARLTGDVRVGDGAHIGAGATVRQSLSIGEGAVVGVGAAVVKDVAPWTVVVGVPARVVDRREFGEPPGRRKSHKGVA
jgi:sugar O-acyltransferase (sialic acid O-acetyltransferase NeuD family)